MNTGAQNHPTEKPHLQRADGAVFPLKTGETVIGRDPSCDIQLQDPSVSKKHCILTWSDRDVSVTDLGSTNHTFVNQTCLREGQVSRLFHGDHVILGRTVLTLIHPGSIAAESREPQPVKGAVPFGSQRPPSESTVVSFDLGPSPCTSDKQPFSEAAFREIRRANERLSIFYDFGRHVGNILDIDRLLRRVARRIMRLVPTDSGVIFLGRLDQYEPFVCWDREGFVDVSHARFSRTAVTKAIEERRGLFIRDIGSQPELGAGQSVQNLKIASTIITPIMLENEVFGALCLSACSHHVDFGPDDFAMISGIAGQIAVAIKNAYLADEIKQATAEKERLEKELEIAAHVQKSILPVAPPSLPGLDIAGISIPAREVGGDFFDYIPLGSNSLGTTIADVSGKGLAAALLTLQSRNVIHAFAKDNPSPADVLKKANSIIYNDYSRADMFLSAFYAIIDLSSMTLRYASAGHNPPLLLRADGTCSSLSSTGSLLGISSDITIADRTLDLVTDDLLALYTDGVSDVRDHARAPFGCEKLTRRIREYRNLPACDIADRIVREVTSLAGHAHFDDATLVIIKIQPQS